MSDNTIARLIAVGLLIWALIPTRPLAAQMTANHELSISLFPKDAKLVGHDRMRIQGPANGRLDLFLSPRARIQKVTLAGRDHPFEVNQGRISLTLDRQPVQDVVELNLDYTCRFDDPVPERPLNTDNPGHGVSGTISQRGTFILSGAGWYPRVVDAHETVDLRVDGPKGIIAVTSGRPLGIDDQGSRTRSRWRIDTPLEGISLSAGTYVVEQKSKAGFSAAVYLFPESRSLADRYLDMSLTYLAIYSALFGDYPFDTFSVVENFFPTGYGFPGYSLLGSRVLRLPFIPYTSLPHEIAHNWWGNGVRVAPLSGNWCEGLTTYVADYLIKERQSAQAAIDYRRQALRNYAALVAEAVDFPLSRFRGRTDPVTKVIGYDKSAMVFHMLREKLGHERFWGALRDLYDRFLFRPASWQDLQQVFEERGDQALDHFFAQWVYRSGAPSLGLEKVHLTGDGTTGYRITGRLVQKKPYFSMAVRMIVETAQHPTEKTVHLSGRQTDFVIETKGRPKKITADPEYHLFRRMAAEELPPTINSLKGARDLTMVLSSRLGPAGRPMARRMGQAFGLASVDVIDESDLDAAERLTGHLLFVGLPENGQAATGLPADLKLAPHAFALSGQRFDQPTDVLFSVFRNPRDGNKIVAILHPLSTRAADLVLHKLSHYGRYSFLAFRDGDNRIKGTWEATSSPMVVDFESASAIQGGQP